MLGCAHLLVFPSLTIWVNNRGCLNGKNGKPSQKLTGFGPDAAHYAGAQVDWGGQQCGYG